MPNRPLINQKAVIPLYTGLATEIADKLVQPGNGVLELENMVAQVTGELSKRPGSANLITPSTGTLPAGGTLPEMWQFTAKAAELIRLSQIGPTPLWPYTHSLDKFLNPIGSAISSRYRGPITTSFYDVVDQVSVGSSARVPDFASDLGYGVVAYEQINAQTGAVAGVVEQIIDLQTGKPIFTNFEPNRQRPRCISIGTNYLLVFTLNFDPGSTPGTPGSVVVDIYNTSSLGAGVPTIVILTAGNVVSPSSLIDVTTIDFGDRARVAYTDSNNIVRAIDFNPVTNTASAFQPLDSSSNPIHAVAAMAWMQDLGASFKSSLITADPTQGVVVHWAFGAISFGAVSVAAADYAIDQVPLRGLLTAGSDLAGVYNVSGYTTSNSASGEFIVAYDVLALNDSAQATVYRGWKVGATVTQGQPYWNTATLASKYWRGDDSAIYCVVAYSNSASPQTPQNSYFVVVDGVPNPVPLAVAMPQAAGGFTGRSSALSSVAPAGIAVASIADLQFVAGKATQLQGVRVMQVNSLRVQDTSTSPPIEAFGYSLTPAGQLLAYDGRLQAEAVLALRPEPPRLTPINARRGTGTTIPFDAGDALIGAPLQPLVVSDGDMVIGTAAIIHSSADYVVRTGGIAQYVFLAGFNAPGFGGTRPIDDRVLNDAFATGTLTVASSGHAANDGSFVISSITRQTSGLATYYVVEVAATTQVNASMGSGTTGSIAGNPTLLGSFLLASPGISNVVGDPTLFSQLLRFTSGPLDVALTLDPGTASFASVTMPSGAVYYRFQTTNTGLNAVAFPSTSATPTLQLQLPDPTLQNKLTLPLATFDQTYLGRRLTIAFAANASNSVTTSIAQVLSSTEVIVTAPSAGLRNEQLGLTSDVTVVISDTPALATGTHAYCAVYTAVDARTGRKLRSPPSLPAVVTTTADFPSVAATVNPLAFTGRDCNVELYRAPTGLGSQFNLAASAPNTPNAPIQLSDDLGDSVVAIQEELFTDGGILPGTPIPGVKLLAQFQKRVFIVSPEAPQSLFYSNPDSAGSNGAGDGLLFDLTNFSIDIIDEHGPITAAQAMDNALVVFKKDAVYAVTGTGPDGTGANGSYQVQLIAAGVGCSNPRSVVLQTGSGTQLDGVWFQSTSERAGIFTVTRGLTVEYTGAGVRRYSGDTIISAIVYPAQSQIRWYTVSGRTLVWSWISKIWSTNTGQPCASAVMFNGKPTYAPTGALDAYVLQEATTYQEGAGESYVPYAAKVASPWLSLAGLKGFERIRRIQGVGRSIGAHVVTVKVYADYDDAKLIGTFTKSFEAGESWDWQVRPSIQKVDAIKVVITGTDQPGALAGTAGFAITAIALVYGMKKGLNKLPDSALMTNS